ncbi:hypothetical protein U9M48_017813 [Paspalum notatum var. saurae]|uniref:Uncharacterized protein n=1 Tax=Paspalum notatum var. saurae TaxID=547442 RepID=A0AAQ3TC65_PASNO
MVNPAAPPPSPCGIRRGRFSPPSIRDPSRGGTLPRRLLRPSSRVTPCLLLCAGPPPRRRRARLHRATAAHLLSPPPSSRSTSAPGRAAAGHRDRGQAHTRVTERPYAPWGGGSEAR